MAAVEKKCWPESFEAIVTGRKTYDLRLADFSCNSGDTLILREWDPLTKEYTGRQISKKVTFVGKTKDWDIWSKEEVERYGYQIIAFH